MNNQKVGIKRLSAAIKISCVKKRIAIAIKKKGLFTNQ